MISVFISVSPYTNDRRRLKLFNNATVWSAEGLYSWKCYILVHFSNHYL